MNYPLKKILLSFHISCGIILFLNLLASFIGSITLIYSLSQIIKYIFLITGVILFFLTSFKDLKAYFSIYVATPLLAIASLIFGIVGIMIIFLMLAFIFPKTIISESNNYKIYVNTRSGSPMKKADGFELTQDKYFIFEKKLAEFKNYENLKNVKINVVNDSAQIRFTKEDYNFENNRTTKYDTIIKIAVD
ncbi:MAG: hypothetical protein V4572_01300 [Bacteroidota bacterium]